MSTHSASAPGKLFILGDYAVLEGATAILTGVRQRALAEIETLSQATESQVVIQMGSEKTCLPVEEVSLLVSAIFCLKNKGYWSSDADIHREFRLDTRQFHRLDKKLGLGSSAALTVALVAAMLKEEGHWEGINSEEFLLLCLEVHTHFQSGVGSGADVATAVQGGILAFKTGDLPRPISLPEGLVCQFIWTGIPAGTTDYIKKLYKWRETEEKAYNWHFDRLIHLSNQGLRACEDQNAASLVDILGAYSLALKALSEETGLMFYNAAHQMLYELATRGGCVYKPSGAGGGDFGLIVSTSAQSVADVAESLEQKGYMTSLVEFSDTGVQIEE